MTSFLIGINGGGTHTELVAVTQHLDILARIETGPGNFHNVGLETARETLHNAITELIRQSGQPASELIGLGAGLAGLDRPADRATFAQLFESICPGVPLTLDNDALIALIAGAGRQFGIVSICGTGSIAMGVDQHGARARGGGWGWGMDDGSGYDIGRLTLNAIAKADDGAAPATVLTERILARLKLNAPMDLIDWLYTPGRGVAEIAALAAETVALAEHDLTATRIMVRAADALAESVIAVARRLDFGGQPFPLVFSGGLLGHSALLRDRCAEAVQTVFPAVVPIHKAHDPALGAAIMALQAMGLAVADETPLPAQSGRRATERRNRLTRDIGQHGQRSSLELITLMNIEDERIAAAIAPELTKIAQLIDATAERFAAGGRLIMIGAGTSGRLAVLDAVECRPTFGVTPDQVIGVIAGGTGALIASVEDAEDSESGGRAAIADYSVGTLDTVIGIAASGGTPYVQGALREATERGALTASVVNVAEAPISTLSLYPIRVVVGAEVIMGSTRLRAGTAQKLVLNMITTGVMVRVGRTFGNLMTDMQSSNLKLQARAVVIVGEATGLNADSATDVLTRSDGEIKTAIAAALLNVEPEEARVRLSAVHGNLNSLIKRDAG